MAKCMPIMSHRIADSPQDQCLLGLQQLRVHQDSESVGNSQMQTTAWQSAGAAQW